MREHDLCGLSGHLSPRHGADLSLCLAAASVCAFVGGCAPPAVMINRGAVPGREGMDGAVAPPSSCRLGDSLPSPPPAASPCGPSATRAPSPPGCSPDGGLAARTRLAFERDAGRLGDCRDSGRLGA